METKFTPGPWSIMGHRDILNIVRMDGAPDKNKYGAVPYAALGGFPDESSKDIIEANANLIAAAPDLYKALERLLGCLDSMHNDPEVLNAFGCHYDLDDLSDAAEAIRKARGEK